MNIIRFVSVAAFLCTISASGQSVAQGPIDVNQRSESGSVSLHLESVPLSVALDELARQSGVRIGYSKSIVAGKDRVTVDLKNVSLDMAFRRLLVGTGLEAVSAPGGGIAIRTRIVAGKAQGVITGKVVDSKSGKGISGANVSLDADMRRVFTDEGGIYRMSGIAAGIHTVIVRLVGYAKQTKSVSVGDGTTVSVDFKLEPSASILDQVVVTGTVIASELKSVPNAITVITAKQIEERGITRIDQLFRGDVPGLFSLNVGANNNAPFDEVVMFSRGPTALSSSSAGVTGATNTLMYTNPIKTYIDGVEMMDSKYMSQIDPISIERIEILTGPQASTIYGSNAINGVMQIFTKRGSDNRPRITLSLTGGVDQNSFSANLAPGYATDASVSGVEGKISYNIGASWNYIGSWTPGKQTQRLSYNSGGRIDLNKFTADISGRQGFTQNNQNGNTAQIVTDLRATGVFSPDPGQGIPSPQIQTLNSRTVGFSAGYRPMLWWSHELIVGSDVSTTTTAKISPSYGTSGFDTVLSFSPSSSYRVSERYSTTFQLPMSDFVRVNLTAGGDHWRTRGSSWNTTPLSLNGSFSCSVAITNFCSRTRPDKNTGAFLQGQLSLFDGLFLTYGVRSDWNPSFGDKARVLPGRYGISIAHEIGSVSAKLRGSYGKSIRPPTSTLKLSSPNTNLSVIAQFGPIDNRLANPYLLPEDRQGGEGGIELYFSNRSSIVVTRFNETTNNLISNVGGVDSVRSLTNTPITAFCSFTSNGVALDADGYCFKYQDQNLNVGSIRNQGWEFQSSINIGPLTARGTYSWTKSRVLGITRRYKALLTGTQFEPGRPFDFMSEHVWALGFTYSSSYDMISLSINGVGMRYISQDGLIVAASQGRLNSSRPRIGTPSGYRSVGSGYATADLNATHRFSQHAEALLQIINLTDFYSNDLNVLNPTIGRQSKVGIRMRW